MSQSVLVTGSKVVLYLNSKVFARVVSFQWHSATPKRPIYGVDNAQPYELAPTTTRCTGALTLLRTQADGGIQGAGMAGNVRDVTREKYFALMLVDLTTDTVLFRADRCTVTDESWQVAARGVMMGSVSFEVIDWGNEVDPTLAP